MILKKIETERLYLRRWLSSDCSQLFQLARDEDVSLPSGWRPHSSVFYSAQVIENTYRNKNHFAIVRKADNLLIGNIVLEPIDVSAYTNARIRQSGLGYWIGKPFWNQGYATEAAKKVIEIGFTKQHLARIWSLSYRNNIRSKKVQRNCGFTYRESTINYSDVEHKSKTIDYYLLTRSDWQKKVAAETTTV